MKKYQASTPEAEVIGAALLAYNEALTYGEFKHILEEHDLSNIDPEAWYPQQLTLDIQKAISKTPGGIQMLVSIGMKIIETAQFPPMESLEDAIGAFAASYPMNFRNQADDDVIIGKKVEDGKIKVVNKSPHSDDMIYGYVYALVHRFKPEGTHPTVKFDDITKRDDDQDTIIWITY